MGLIPGLGRSTGKGNDNPLQHSCLGKSYGQRSLVGYSPWGLKELDMTEHTRAHTQDLKEFWKLSLANTWPSRTLSCWRHNLYLLSEAKTWSFLLLLHVLPPQEARRATVSTHHFPTQLGHLEDPTCPWRWPWRSLRLSSQSFSPEVSLSLSVKGKQIKMEKKKH